MRYNPREAAKETHYLHTENMRRSQERSREVLQRNHNRSMERLSSGNERRRQVAVEEEKKEPIVQQQQRKFEVSSSTASVFRRK